MHGEFLVPDSAQVVKRCLAGSVGAPLRVRVHRGIARDIDHHRPAGFACGCSQRTQESLREPERPQDISCQRPFEVLAICVRQQSEGRRSEVGRIVDQHVDPSQCPEHLNCNRIYVVFPRYVAGDSVRRRMGLHRPLHPIPAACDRTNTSSALRGHRWRHRRRLFRLRRGNPSHGSETSW